MAGNKILVVDDEIHIVQVVAIKLRNNGYEVITAENGEVAYGIACVEKPDAIITDLQMPVMNGVEMVEKLRENADTANIPVIMLTARGFAVEEDKMETLKIADCLSKPFSPREVMETLEKVLSPVGAS